MGKVNEIRESFRIARLKPGDAHLNSDSLQSFRELILANEEMYPGIARWLNKKVIPGIKSGERVAFVGYIGEKPVVSAVVKRGNHAKFCHLRISDQFQNEHLGDIFFSLMAMEVRHMAEEIHFTLPEGLWERKHSFFQSFGFQNIIKTATQYRRSEQELRCSAPFSSVWRNVLGKLSTLSEQFSIGGYSMANDLLMSIQPRFAGRVLEGQKRIEIRKKFSSKWIGHTVCLYASSPTKALVGEARISNVVNDTPENIWSEFGYHIGCSKQEFDAYTKTAQQVYAIAFDTVRPYKKHMRLADANFLLDADLTPPQSYCTLERGQPWAQAVSIAAMFHGNLKPAAGFTLQEH